MKFWLVIEGEKRGPFPDYEIRGMIEKGLVSESTVCWHEGLDGWKPLASLSLFEREFDSHRPKEMTMDQGVDAAIPKSVPEMVPTRTYWARRFWARWLDLQLYAGLWWLVLYLGHADIEGILKNLWGVLFLYLPWVPIEAMLISSTGTTPGKWLLGLKVRNDDGSALNARQSLIRAIRVYFLGIGMGWSLVSLVCQTISFFHVRATGKTIWDMHARHRVEGVSLSYWRIPAFVVAMILASQMQWIVIAPYVLDDMQKRMPELRKWMGDHPPFHLPKR